MGTITKTVVTPETVPYPYFMLFVIYNKKARAWHKGGAKKFVHSKYVTGAKMYQSCTYAKKVAVAICEDEQDISDFVVLRYEARATEAIVCSEGSVE